MNSRDYRVAPKDTVDLSKWDPDDTAEISSKEIAKAILKENRKSIADLQERLYAEGKQSLLVVFQALDTGGKDGCIKDVFKGVNPTGLKVWSFKSPTDEELSHDFLWRIHQHTPAAGGIGVFNRSHYEDVLVVRVKDLVPDEVWKKRYGQINAFEETLEERGTRIIKFYLHISKDEQKERLEARLENPEKHWKFSSADLVERGYWDAYQEAFEETLGKTSTDDAPWYVIPANKKWFRNALVSNIIRETLENMNPQFPAPEEGLDKVVVQD